ncbi:MAG: class I SAM-dependent methyltransferase [Bacteroidota bacterium]
MQKINECPICGHNQQKEFLKSQDWFLSQQEFVIEQCEKCGFLFTNPRPSDDDLGGYYKSEAYISHSNSGQGIVNQVYKLVRGYTVKQKYKVVRMFKPGRRILDIGCGTGELLNFFKESNWEVRGIEPDADARAFAKKEYDLPVDQEDALDQMDDNSFDVITMWHVLEHVAGLNKRMRTIRRLLKDDGVVVIAVPNPEAFDAQYYGKYWAAYDLPRHLYHFKKQDIRKLAVKHQMFVKHVFPMKFDSFYVSMLSEKYKRGSVNYWKAFFTGLKSNYKAAKTQNYSSLIYILGKDEA